MDLDDGTGFDRGFSTEAVHPPGCDPADLLMVDGQVELRYMHFSVAMHAHRRLARWVAWNIDGLTRWDGDDISRDGVRFVPDPGAGRRADDRGGVCGQPAGPGSSGSPGRSAVGEPGRGAGREPALVLLHQHHPADGQLQPSPGRTASGDGWRTRSWPRRAAPGSASSPGPSWLRMTRCIGVCRCRWCSGRS